MNYLSPLSTILTVFKSACKRAHCSAVVRLSKIFIFVCNFELFMNCNKDDSGRSLLCSVWPKRSKSCVSHKISRSVFCIGVQGYSNSVRYKISLSINFSHKLFFRPSTHSLTIRALVHSKIQIAIELSSYFF